MDRLLSERAVLDVLDRWLQRRNYEETVLYENIKYAVKTTDGINVPIAQNDRVHCLTDEAYSELCLLAAKGREAETIIHCKDCKYFEYDVVANVDGIPLIVAHEMCNKWGDGCKTSEDGYCFLAERKTEDEA